MKNLADRVRYVRKKLGINQAALGAILGASEGKAKGWEQGTTKNMKAKDALILQNKYGFSQEWLMDGTGDIMLERDELLLDDIQTTVNLLANNLVIPFYNEISASAGYGTSNEEMQIPTSITISRTMIPHTKSNKIEAIRVCGNSMSGTIEDEDIIFIDKNDTEPVDGKIYVIYLCGDVYVKRMFIDPKTKSILLKSDNPLFPQITTDCEDFRIIGRVVANMKIKKL